MSKKYHINDKNEVRICKAKVQCRFSERVHFSDVAQAEAHAHELNNNIYGALPVDEYNFQREILKRAQAGEKLTGDEIEAREKYVTSVTDAALANNEATDFIYAHNGVWSEARERVHNEILEEVKRKYAHIPREGGFIISGGLSGAGKTTVLREHLGDELNNYAIINSDDFKEILAEKGLIPTPDGLTPMEASTLVHKESAMLSTRWMEYCIDNNLNSIVDFTAKDESDTLRHINLFERGGYDIRDMQYVFVDISVDTSKDRAVSRYRQMVSSKLGGRFLPVSVYEKNVPSDNQFNSRSAETCYNLSSRLLRDYGVVPIVYNNEGTGPVRSSVSSLKG